MELSESVDGSSSTDRQQVFREDWLKLSVEVQAHHIPLSDLPPLPARACEYFAEPFCGAFVVSSLSVFLVAVTLGASMGHDTSIVRACVITIWTVASIAFVSTLFIFFGTICAEIRRSQKTCYPIPVQVAEYLKGISKDLPSNIGGDDGRSYCVRCFVWRPEEETVCWTNGRSHHCSICQRCVTSFDHHCSFYGRCIIGSNMPCFLANITMMFLGLGVTAIAVLASVTDIPSQYIIL